MKFFDVLKEDDTLLSVIINTFKSQLIKKIVTSFLESRYLTFHSSPRNCEA